MSLLFRKSYTALKEAAKQWWDRDPFRQSAIIAYYAIFSLPALLVIIVSSAGLAFSQEAVSGEISAQISSVMGKDTAKQVEEIIAKTGGGEDSLIATIIGIVTLIFGATGVFAQLQTSLNLIWGVKQNPKAGIFKMLRDRLFSFGLIVSIGFLLLISLVVSSVLTYFGSWMESQFSESLVVVVNVLNFVISLGVVSVLFALMFKILPDVKIRWKDVWVGAIFTALLFTLGKYGLAVYFGKAQPASGYGAAGSIVLILLWVSYSCMIFFLGAEFTKKYTTVQGIKLQPSETAMPIAEAEIMEKS